ncbi:hypothetical protein [Pseudomarimonas salicorniae]|uniref:Uncharacterized protein n=1 Tax=Pseudomarimonas salicorniae TaxID=2933270 RepID=A0ABT0GIU2_9GAMM|nr:hypothetical protein [Lysobacter sp. CAU 1642]MCK7593937.1 hypothetical protein [Lysobacter sp. CAU 1642]
MFRTAAARTQALIDPLLALALLALLAGGLGCLLFSAELAAAGHFAPATVYGLLLPASAVITRLLQLRGAAPVTVVQRRSLARRGMARRTRPRPRVRLRLRQQAALLAALLAPLPR